MVDLLWLFFHFYFSVFYFSSGQKKGALDLGCETLIYFTWTKRRRKTQKEKHVHNDLSLFVKGEEGEGKKRHLE